MGRGGTGKEVREGLDANVVNVVRFIEYNNRFRSKRLCHFGSDTRGEEVLEGMRKVEGGERAKRREELEGGGGGDMQEIWKRRGRRWKWKKEVEVEGGSVSVGPLYLIRKDNDISGLNRFPRYEVGAHLLSRSQLFEVIEIVNPT